MLGSYALALMQPEGEDLEAVAELGVMEAAMAGYTLTNEQAEAIIAQAMSVCPDYLKVINQAIRHVRANR
jgi:hypothetical protein